MVLMWCASWYQKMMLQKVLCGGLLVESFEVFLRRKSEVAGGGGIMSKPNLIGIG